MELALAGSWPLGLGEDRRGFGAGLGPRAGVRPPGPPSAPRGWLGSWESESALQGWAGRFKVPVPVDSRGCSCKCVSPVFEMKVSFLIK